MAQLFTNNAISLSSNILSPIGLSIHVIPGDGHLFPQPVNATDFFLVTLEDSHNTVREIIKVVDRIGDELIIDPAGRGFEGTTPRMWAVDTLVDHRITAFTFRNVVSAAGIPGAAQDPNVVNIVPATTTKNADIFTISYPNNLACKWLLTVLDQASGRVTVSEIIACYRGPLAPPKFSVYAKTGDALKYTVDVIASGTTLELNVVNTDTVDLTITYVRINYH
jgi:hypothetical protein